MNAQRRSVSLVSLMLALGVLFLAGAPAHRRPLKPVKVQALIPPNTDIAVIEIVNPYREAREYRLALMTGGGRGSAVIAEEAHKVSGMLALPWRRGLPRPEPLSERWQQQRLSTSC